MVFTVYILLIIMEVVGGTENPRYFFTSERPEFYISAAFSWIQTPEGLRYWGKKDLDWNSYLQNINKRI